MQKCNGAQVGGRKDVCVGGIRKGRERENRRLKKIETEKKNENMKEKEN